MRKHGGFTLLELLVVMVIVGILAAVATLSIVKMSSTADANNVINNMLMLRQATLIWYKENHSRMVYDSNGLCKIKTNGTEQTFDEFVKSSDVEILKYLDNKGSLILRSSKDSTNNTGDYTLQSVNGNKQWYVCYNAGTTSWTIEKYGEESSTLDVKKKLAGRAASLGLKGKANINDTPKDQYNDHKFACMLIKDFTK